MCLFTDGQITGFSIQILRFILFYNKQHGAVAKGLACVRYLRGRKSEKRLI